MSWDLLDVMYLPGRLRGALAAAIQVSVGVPAGVAEVISIAAFTLIMAGVYFGVALSFVVSCRNRSREQEAAERFDAPVPGDGASWSACFPHGHEADACAWLLSDLHNAQAFEAAALRLERQGVIRLESAAPEEGGMRIVRLGSVPEHDRIGTAVLRMLFRGAGCRSPLPRRVSLFEALSDADWKFEVEGSEIGRFLESLGRTCEEGGLSLPKKERESDTANYQAVAFVLVGLVGAIWFSFAIPSLITLAIFIGSSVLFAEVMPALRHRRLTPAGARVTARLDALRGKFRRALESGGRIGDSSVPVRALMEFAVVLGFTDEELEHLAANSGSADVGRLFEGRRDLELAPDAVRVALKRAGLAGSPSWAARLRAIGKHAVDWYDYETAPGD